MRFGHAWVRRQALLHRCVRDCSYLASESFAEHTAGSLSAASVSVCAPAFSASSAVASASAVAPASAFAAPSFAAAASVASTSSVSAATFGTAVALLSPFGAAFRAAADDFE